MSQKKTCACRPGEPCMRHYLQPAIEYKTVFTKSIPSEDELQKLGEEGWRLGGVASETNNVPYTTHCHYYHFWRERI